MSNLYSFLCSGFVFHFNLFRHLPVRERQIEVKLAPDRCGRGFLGVGGGVENVGPCLRLIAQRGDLKGTQSFVI